MTQIPSYHLSEENFVKAHGFFFIMHNNQKANVLSYHCLIILASEQNVLHQQLNFNFVLNVLAEVMLLSQGRVVNKLILKIYNGDTMLKGTMKFQIGDLKQGYRRKQMNNEYIGISPQGVNALETSTLIRPVCKLNKI